MSCPAHYRCRTGTHPVPASKIVKPNGPDRQKQPGQPPARTRQPRRAAAALCARPHRHQPQQARRRWRHAGSVFPLRQVFYRPDRMAAPVTGLPVTPLRPGDGWCDAPGDPNYNRFVPLPYPASHERLWREDGLYDVIVVIGHNCRPRAQGRRQRHFHASGARGLRPHGGLRGTDQSPTCCGCCATAAWRRACASAYLVGQHVKASLHVRGLRRHFRIFSMG